MAVTYIGPLPYQLIPNTLADATQVMADFNWIVTQVNANVPQADGGTYNNITITGNTNILTGATFYNGTFISAALTNPVTTGGTFTNPTFAGVPTTPTQAFSDSSTQVVNSAWVRGAVASITGINLAMAQTSPALVFNAPGF